MERDSRSVHDLFSWPKLFAKVTQQLSGLRRCSNYKDPRFASRPSPPPRQVFNKVFDNCRGCGAVGRAVASHTKGPRFESQNNFFFKLLAIYFSPTITKLVQSNIEVHFKFFSYYKYFDKIFRNTLEESKKQQQDRKTNDTSR